IPHDPGLPNRAKIFQRRKPGSISRSSGHPQLCDPTAKDHHNRRQRSEDTVAPLCSRTRLARLRRWQAPGPNPAAFPRGTNGAWLARARAVDAPDPGAARRDEQEDEAIKRDRFTAVGDGVKALAPVHHPVTDSRHAACNESSGTGEEAKDDEAARDE